MNPDAALFEELDYRETPMGELILQRRQVLELEGREVYEVRLNSEYLMSSLFFDAEIALSDLGMEAIERGQCRVLVGGLGLGYTAVAALRHEKTASVCVIEALKPVIEWHQQGLVPNGAILAEDPRCELLEADFFEVVAGRSSVDAGVFDVILLDIDHSPELLLNPSHAAFYTKPGLSQLKKMMSPAGVFAMWSNDPPSPEFSSTLEEVFEHVDGRTVVFDNPLTGGQSHNGVYVCW